MFAPIWSDVKDVWTRTSFATFCHSHDNELDRPEDYINHSLYFEAKTFLHGLFVVEDKLSMAHSPGNRVPFMDNDLVDFAMQCPVGLKLNNLAEVIRINENEPGQIEPLFSRRPSDGKQILRDMMARHIPDDHRSGREAGVFVARCQLVQGREYSVCIAHPLESKIAHI
jgi:asparagine synthase (glutamine-hydrolysing)